MAASRERKLVVVAAVAAVLSNPGYSTVRSQETEAPQYLNDVERVNVRLVILDAVALDRRGRTIPDLTVEEFEVLVDGRPVAVDTLDVDCLAESIEEPRGVRHPSARGSPLPSAVGRKIILAFDYLHLDPTQRSIVLEHVSEMIEYGTAPGDQLMLVALTGGLRIEQPLTSDRAEALASLHRMQYDISLWQPDFFHQNEFGFVDGLNALFDVLGAEPGTKTVVLFSAIQDVPLDTQFEQIAASAAVSRSAIYAVDARGLLADDGHDKKKVSEADLKREAKSRLGGMRTEIGQSAGPSQPARGKAPG